MPDLCFAFYDRMVIFDHINKTIAAVAHAHVDPREVGQALDVRAMMLGRVIPLGDKLIINVELVDVSDGRQLWGEQYDRFSSDILELQQNIAQDVSGKLHLKLTGEEEKRMTKRPTESTEAYHLYIKARYYLNKRLTETIQKAVEYFQWAIDIDPAYALAYVGLADCYPLLTLYGSLRPQDAYTKAEAAARKALEIDDSISEAHNALGVIELFYNRNWDAAQEMFQHAISSITLPRATPAHSISRAPMEPACCPPTVH